MYRFSPIQTPAIFLANEKKLAQLIQVNVEVVSHISKIFRQVMVITCGLILKKYCLYCPFPRPSIISRYIMNKRI